MNVSISRSRAAAVTRTRGCSSRTRRRARLYDLAARSFALAERGRDLAVVESKTSCSKKAARSSGARRSSRARNATDKSDASSVAASAAGASSDERLGQPRPDISLPLDAALAQPIDAEPCRGRHEPTLGRANLTRRGIVPAEVRFLNHIVGIGA